MCGLIDKVELPGEWTPKFKGTAPSDELDLSFNTFLEGDNGLGALDPFHGLNPAIKYLAQVLRISANNFGKHTIGSGAVMQFDYLGNIPELFHGVFVLRALFQKNPQESGDVETDQLWVNLQVRAFYDSHFFHLLHAHMNGPPGYFEFFGNLGIGNRSVRHQRR